MMDFEFIDARLSELREIWMDGGEVAANLAWREIDLLLDRRNELLALGDLAIQAE